MGRGEVGLRWAVWGLVLSLWTAALLSPVPVELRQEVIPEEAHFSASKGLHLVGYLGLILLTTILPVRGRRRLFFAGVIFLHAPLGEALQNLAPPRMGSLRDVGIDLAGALLGLWLARRWYWPSQCGSVGEDAADDAAPADRQRAA